jgi:hypothetical protein
MRQNHRLHQPRTSGALVCSDLAGSSSGQPDGAGSRADYRSGRSTERYERSYRMTQLRSFAPRAVGETSLASSSR